MVRHTAYVTLPGSNGKGWPRLRWAIKIAAPPGPYGDVWGDVFFASDLSAALRRLGQEVRVDRLGEWDQRGAAHDDVNLALRGLTRFEPIEGAVNLLWVISHPDDVTTEEIQSGYDKVFSAGPAWARDMRSAGYDIAPLLQATAPHRFRPNGWRWPRGLPLFVGSTRGIFRPVVRDVLDCGVALRIYGGGWEEFVPAEWIVAERLANARLPAAYRGATVVLNDHWEDMAKKGFLSNRLFDAVAAGARVISDDVAGLHEVFGSSVQTYSSQAELRDLLDPRSSRWPGAAERRGNARRIASLHSFDLRARELLNAVVHAAN